MARRPPAAAPAAALVYKFAELSIVTSETLEECVNTWVAEGWTFDGVQFVTTEASRRPAMAFVSFVREQGAALADAAIAAAEVSDPAPTSPSASTSRRRR